jgi:signal transduction histidine kinase
MYRIAQAALDATAAARQVAIRLGRDGRTVRLTVEADAPIDEGSAEAMTIRDWTAALGGELELTRTARGSQLAVAVAS